AGTHGGSKKPSSRSTTIWLGVALATLLVGSGVFAMGPRDRGSPTQAVFTAPQPTVIGDPAQTPPAPVQPVTLAPTGYVAAEPTVVQPMPTVIGASGMMPSSPNTAAALPGTAVRTEPTPRRTAPPPPPPPQRAKTTGRPS